MTVRIWLRCVILDNSAVERETIVKGTPYGARKFPSRLFRTLEKASITSSACWGLGHEMVTCLARRRLYRHRPRHFWSSSERPTPLLDPEVPRPSPLITKFSQRWHRFFL